MDKQELKNRLKEIEKELKRERFGLERYEAQCHRWQKELDDVETEGFFSFLVNSESKKREAEEKEIGEELATVCPLDDSTASVPSDGSDAIGMSDDESSEKALALLEKIEKVIEVPNQSILEAFSQLASARVRAMSKGRPGRGGARMVSMPRSDSSGGNIQMVLDCLDDPVQELCQLLNPVVANLIKTPGSKSAESLEVLREKLLDLSNLGRYLKTPEAYSLAGLSLPIDLGDEEKMNEISTSLIQMATIATLIQGFLEE